MQRKVDGPDKKPMSVYFESLKINKVDFTTNEKSLA